MKLKLQKTGESDRFIHLTMVVGTRNCGSILVPLAEWESFEEESGFMAQVGTIVECELSATKVNVGEGLSESTRAARADHG